tara:strand:- start:60 stop:998 length:939 start_codon:yes stop_codon:yes gene_type:complete
MCGIVAYIGKDTPINKLMYLMHDNDSRGGHSSGVYIDSKIYKSVDESGNLLSMIDETSANLFIGHTRYATHGVKTAENTHPYINGKYCGVHNGVLSNYEEVLKEESLDKVDVDSKAIYSILNLTDNYADLGRFSGTINAVWTENNGQLYVYRRNNPLFRLRTEDGIYFSSLKEGLIEIADDPKKVKEVTKDKLFIYSASGELIESIKIPVTAVEKLDSKNWYEYGNYSGTGTAGFKSTWTKKEEDEWNRSFNVEEEEPNDYMYSELWYSKMQTSITTFEKAFQDMKYHGWLSTEETEDIEFLLEQMKDEVYI